jgi:hypothetical protein
MNGLENPLERLIDWVNESELLLLHARPMSVTLDERVRRALLFTRPDVPNLIGYLGTIFGKHQMNIAQMTVGRQLPGGEAIAVLSLHSQPPDEAIREVRSHPQISSLSVVKLPPAAGLPAWFG